ncbi:PREDICTED: uncharacterized protein LOC103334074 [Prunus mume]|uniref:Uncharacterized protein LOC103334074 n=1 Tax=Prunus mume TaxID=102107 RepID=A0ABM0P6X4_PRUMU|nr:PREDICTED: uncharacterized protein LOC103334074 [Prunus mume]
MVNKDLCHSFKIIDLQSKAKGNFSTKKGFIDTLRPVVGLDAYHIKGQHPGQLLSAVGVDPNNGMYPIAYAVADAENYATWTWFLELLAVDLGIENSNGYVFITNRQKDLIDAVGDMFPNSKHRHCLKHLHANFILAGYRGLVLKQHMDATARSTTIHWFQAEMKKLQDLSGSTFNWLSRLDPMQWCRSHFRTHSKCGILLNNMCETFNKSILDARDKPIITLLERIMYYIMLLMATRREVMEKWAHDVGPRVLATLEKLKKQSAWCIPRLAGESKYEVKCFGGTQVVVDLRNISCSCRQWDLTEIPCKYACAAIGQLNGNHISYVHDYYKKEAFIKAYTPMVHPMVSLDLWAKTNLPHLLPPQFYKQPGRPKKTRKASASEPSPSFNPKAKHLPRYNLEIKCSICKQPDYNKRKCPRVNEARSSSQVYSKHVILQILYVWHSDMDSPMMFVGQAKKRSNHHQASSQSGQAPQPSHQATQPSQPFHQPATASQFEQSSEAFQFEQASQAPQFEQASQAALFKQVSQSQAPNSSQPLQASHKGKLGTGLYNIAMDSAYSVNKSI